MTDPIAPTRTPDHRERAADRPPPRITSLAGAAAGLFLLFSLTAFLSEVGGTNQRAVGVVLALLFEGVGVGLLLLGRNGRAATAGVTLTALGLVPLLVYLFVDVRNPGRTINDVGSFTSTATLILIIAAGLWLTAYLVGPGRRYGFYLGAALLAIWLVAVVQIVDAPLSQIFGRAGAYTSVGPASPSFDDPFQDPGRDSFDVLPGPSTSSDGPENPSTKLGIVSLLFGGAYLAGVGWRDRRGDRRQGTVFAAVAIPILTVAVIFLASPLDTTGSAFLAMALGAGAVWFGTSAERRFTSWYGTFAAVVATVVLVDQAVGESARLSGLILLVLGVAVALVAMRVTDSPGPATTAGEVPTPTVPPWSGPPGTSPWSGPAGSTPWGSGPPAITMPEPSPELPDPAAPVPEQTEAPSPSPWERPEPG